jgi:hypothetical protein
VLPWGTQPRADLTFKETTVLGLIISAIVVGETRGVDWIKLIIQVALAAAGVALVAGRYAPGRRSL